MSIDLSTMFHKGLKQHLEDVRWRLKRRYETRPCRKPHKAAEKSKARPNTLFTGRSFQRREKG